MLYDALGLLLLVGAIAPWTAMVLAEVRACRRFEEPYTVIPLELWRGYGPGLYYWTLASSLWLLVGVLLLAVR